MGFGHGFSSSKGSGLQVASGSEGQILRFKGSSGKTVVGTDDLKFIEADGLKLSGSLIHSGNIEPETDDVFNLGRTGQKYKDMNIKNIQATNVITGDLHLKNERGDWTLVEEKESITLRNNITGAKYKIVMEKIKD
jgi:hypothetical protein